ncbi:hypothetical protein K435DRAFT_797330 [Dendrothele bispora CBS 962.96]|uniref:Uncharacterized protein n=1 Tax=Dendrothele bispora (strain CBS 962.96) TaxID=1314807 RepID=A0A4S8M3G2_DENBC|nr:hypothetical protein K435DRAFT_797330 [Dendrothele bispora CBS 962.96]
MNPNRPPPPSYVYRLRRPGHVNEHPPIHSPAHNDEYDPVVRSQFTNPTDIDDRDGQSNFRQNDNDYVNFDRRVFVPVASMLNYERDNDFPPNPTANIHRLERDTPFTAWTSNGDKVVVSRHVVDTVGMGITRAVVCSSLRDGNVEIVVLPWHQSVARNDKPVGFSLLRLVLQVSLAAVVTFGIINGLHLNGVELLRLLSQYLTKNSHAFEATLLTINDPCYTLKDVVLSFLCVLSVTVLVNLGISKIIPET